MVRSVVILAVVVCLVVGGVSVAGASQYSPIFLDPGGATACDINNSGQILGMSSDYGIVWNTDGSERRLYSTPLYHAPTTTVNAINDSGVVVGGVGADNNYLGSHPSAASWGATARYAGLLSDSGSIDGMAYSVNSSGSIAGYYRAYPFPLTDNACIWNSSGQRTDLSADGSSRAYGMNDGGSAVGFTTGTNGSLACVWDVNGVRTDLLLPTEAATSVASCINGRGIVAGTWSPYGQWTTSITGSAAGLSTQSVPVSTPRPHACVWGLDGSVTTLDALAGFDYSIVSDINASGQMVGFCFGVGYSGPPYRACMWNADGSVVDLGLGAKSEALGINDAGQIAGWTTSSGGVTNAVVWSPVPEPASIAALVSGLIGIGTLGARRRSRS